MAERVAALAGETEALRTVKQPDLPDVAELDHDLADLEGGGVYRVVHLGADLEVNQAADAFRAIASHLAHPYPAMVVQQWLVLAAGRRLSQSALEMVRALHEGALEHDIAFGGTILASQSSEDSVAHSREEEIGFGADIAYCLAATEFASTLDAGGIWAVGASSVFYDSPGCRAAAGALVVQRFLRERLLSDRQGEDPQNPARGEGREWLRDQGLQAATEAEQLLASGDGSVMASIWAEVPDLPLSAVSYWPDRLSSWFDFVTQKRLPRAREQIEDNARARLLAAKLAITSRLLGDLQTTPVIDRARLLALGMVDAVDELQEGLAGVRRPEVEGATLDELRDELEQAIRRLPYAPAVLVHSAVLSVMVATVAALTVISGGGPALVAGLTGFVLTGAWGVGKWVRRLLRVQRARSGYLEQMRALLEADLVEHARGQQLSLLAALREWLVGLPGDAGAAGLRSSEDSPEPAEGEREEPDADDGEVEHEKSTEHFDTVDVTNGVLPSLAQLELEAESAARWCEHRSVDRASPLLHTTRYAVTVPSSSDISTDQLLAKTAVPSGRALDDLLGGALFHDRWILSSDEIRQRCDSALDPFLRQGLWPDLAGLLESSSATREVALALLRASVAPMLTHVEDGIGFEATHQTFTPDGVDLRRLDADDRSGIAALLQEAGLDTVPATTGLSGSANLLLSLDTVLLGSAWAEPSGGDEA